MARPSTFFPRRCGQAILLLAALLGCGEEPAPAHRPPAESTRRMADRLQQVARNTVPEENIFQNEQRVEHYRAKLAQAQKLTDRVPLMLEVATEYLLAGHPEQALEQFDQVSEELAAQGSKLSPEVQRRIRERKALCYVRLGEQEKGFVDGLAELDETAHVGTGEGGVGVSDEALHGRGATGLLELR